MYSTNHPKATSCVRESKVFNLFWVALTILAVLAAFSISAAVTVNPAEMVQKNQWVQQNLLTATNLPPFSFTYQGQPSSILLPLWKREETSTNLDPSQIQHVIVWTHNGFQVKCVAVEYSDYPEVEWTLYLKNIGTNNTPIMENIQGLDTSFSRTNGPDFVLYGIKGDMTTADSYEPYQITLRPNVRKTFAPPESGKSSDGPDGWPYYNLQMPGGGVILAIGWPGQWASSFTRDAANALRIEGGQQLTHLLLKPHEEIRTPLIAMLFWQGTNIVRAQNIWRHFYIAHTLPKVGAQPQGPLKQIQVNGDDTGYVQSYLDAGIIPDICWRDAGAGTTTWYPSDDGPYAPGGHAPQPAFANWAWLNTGTWEVDARKFTNGFRPFTDWIHDRNMKFVLWFEPERVGSPTSWLGKNHPEWLLPATDTTVGAILNLGNSDALDWLVKHVDRLIKSQGIDWYREDMNGKGPLPAWRNNDAPDRQGITENMYVQGHLKYWDELKRRNSGMSLDSCASGGRRNDLETMRRAVPLLRSDFQFPDSQKGVFEGNQGHTYGLSFWLPFQGSGVLGYDPYSYRSFYMASFGMGGLTSQNKAAQKQAYAECTKISPYMLFGDYYPLTPYSLSEDAWIAWQFNRAETGEGCVQAFRHPKSELPAMKLKLQGLDTIKTYEIEDFDKNERLLFSGKELIENGLPVTLGVRGSAVFRYNTINH
jgi:alpha-galactosidase